MLCKENSCLIDVFIDLVKSMSDADYCHMPDTAVSSIGAHCRHVIDHYQLFLTHVDSGHVSYDQRERDNRLETDRSYAIDALTQIKQSLLPIDDYSKPLTVALSVSPDSQTPVQQSTVGRELTFLYSHTVHHHAMISLLLNHRGQTVPEGFGVAPSTQQYRRQA